MKKLPTVTDRSLRTMTLSQLIEVRSIADDHFFAEMRKRTEKPYTTTDSPQLVAARGVQALVQNELGRRAELEKSKIKVRRKQ